MYIIKGARPFADRTPFLSLYYPVFNQTFISFPKCLMVRTIWLV